MEQAITRRTVRFTVAAIASCIGISALAQIPVDEDGYAVESLGPIGAAASTPDESYGEQPATDVVFGEAELQEIVGPIALYPDDLIAIVLPASTYPLQIVQAARFLEAYENDSTLEPEEDWDESVVALLNYPDVLRMLDEDIDWTWQLGQAVIDQQPDVIAAVEGFRNRAYVAGNLKTDEYQEVRHDDDIIEIVPIEDDVIYVPYYEPEEVVVYQRAPVYHYYPSPRPVYYYPYPVGHAFSTGYFWGVTTAFHIGWSSNYLRVYHPSYWGHPYFGRSYYGHYYRRPSINIYNTTYVNHRNVDRYRDGDHWAPRRRAGARQSDYYSRTRTHGRLRAEHHQRNDSRAVLQTSYQGNSQAQSTSARSRPAISDRASSRDSHRSANRPASGQSITARNDTRRTQDAQRAGTATATRAARRSEPATTLRSAQRSAQVSPPRAERQNERASTARPVQRRERAVTGQTTRRPEQAAQSRPVQQSARAESTSTRAPRQNSQRATHQPAAPARAEMRAPPAKQQATRVERKAEAGERGERRREARKPRRSDK